MRLPLSLARAIHVGRVDWPQLRDAADRIVKADDKRSRVKRSPGTRSVDRREQRKDERRKRMADLREAVMVRAEGRCEVCGDEAAHAHHVLSGPDRRRHEAVDTMLALCPECHRRIHAGDVATLDHANTYCSAHGMVRAAFALGKRLAKIAESRAQHPEAESRESGRETA
jgi:hypothetical protein